MSGQKVSLFFYASYSMLYYWTYTLELKELLAVRTATGKQDIDWFVGFCLPKIDVCFVPLY